MSWLKTILLVEDNPSDVKLTLEAIVEYRIANEVVVLHDGAEPSITCSGAKASQRLSRVAGGSALVPQDA